MKSRYFDTILLFKTGTSARSFGPVACVRFKRISRTSQQDGGDDDEVRPVCEYGITLVDSVRATERLDNLQMMC